MGLLHSEGSNRTGYCRPKPAPIPTNEAKLEKSRHFRDRIAGTGRHQTELHEQEREQEGTETNVGAPLGTPTLELRNTTLIRPETHWSHWPSTSAVSEPVAMPTVCGSRGEEDCTSRARTLLTIIFAIVTFSCYVCVTDDEAPKKKPSEVHVCCGGLSPLWLPSEHGSRLGKSG